MIFQYDPLKNREFNTKVWGLSTSPGQLWHPGETKHVDRLRPTAQVVCISILTTVHEAILVQPGSILGVHQKASEQTIQDCCLVSKNLQTKKKKKKINFNGSKCGLSRFVCRQFNFLPFRFFWSGDRRSPPTFVPSFWNWLLPFSRSPPDLVEPK